MIRDYTDRIAMDYNKLAMSVAMGGGNPTVGMEGFLYYHRQNYMGIKFKALLKSIEEETEQDVLAIQDEELPEIDKCDLLTYSI